jgi:hypothetical protein
MDYFSLYWNVSNVSVTRNFSTRRNIKKPVLFPRYQGNIGNFEAMLAYVGSKEIDPASSLNIIKVEDSIPENSRSAFSGETVWTGNIGYSSARYFLLTDVSGDYVSPDTEPFYWKHVLPSEDIDPNSIAILDMDLNEVDSESYYALRIEARDATDIIISGSYESCSVFSNYSNSYNQDTGEIIIYFVRYSVSGSTHYQILNQESAFTEAGLDDISLVTGQLKSWRKVYNIASGPSYFTVTTPTVSNTYYLKPLENSRIIVRDPIDRSDQSPWFVTISNGSFSTIRNNNNFTYSIPEFANQIFSPLYPYKVEVEEEAEYLRSDIIKVNRSSLKVDSSLFIMDILVKDSSGNVLYALTTDTSKAGNFYTEGGDRVLRTVETDNAWVTWESNEIVGWDTENGFIHLQREYSDTRFFYVTYYYTETGYELTTLNVNPVFDENYDTGQFYVIYTVPVGGSNNNLSQTVSLQYLVVDRSGRITQASQNGSGGNLDVSTNINIGEQYMYYSEYASSTSSIVNWPGQTYVDITDTSEFPSSGILKWENPTGTTNYQAYDRIIGNRIYFETFTLVTATPIGQTFELHSFITPYTTASTTNLYQWLVLAEIHTQSTSRVDELSIIDLRMPGGVIKDKHRTDAVNLDPHSVWAFPETITSMGQPIPGDSCAVVKVPYTLLKEYGGSFTVKQVEAIIAERHLAVGVLPVVIFHGAIPEITSITATTSSITVTWESEGTDYRYYIYYSSLPDGPWTRANSVPFEDQLYGNTYTITGLTSRLVYYIAISSIDTDDVEGPKSVAWGIKVRSS